MATLIAWAAFILGLIALGYGWKLSRELGMLRRRLDRYNRALYDANDEIRQLREHVAESTAQLRLAVRQRAGEPGFVPDMTVREASMMHPQAHQVLASFHVGGCSNCAVEPDETLSAACARSGADVDEIVRNLNLLVTVGNDSDVQPVKIPNLVLDL